MYIFEEHMYLFILNREICLMKMIRVKINLFFSDARCLCCRVLSGPLPLCHLHQHRSGQLTRGGSTLQIHVADILDARTTSTCFIQTKAYYSKISEKEGGIVPNRSFGAQQAFSTHQCECGESKNVCTYSCCVVLCVILL